MVIVCHTWNFPVYVETLKILLLNINIQLLTMLKLKIAVKMREVAFQGHENLGLN